MAISGDFHAKNLENLGWRQGSILDETLFAIARESAPDYIVVNPGDWLIVTSHDCDIANYKLENEPNIEVIRATVVEGTAAPDKQLILGRNPRSLSFIASSNGQDVVLNCRIHDRWLIPREQLVKKAPSPEKSIEQRVTSLIATWLAKRYIRPAFPGEFERRWKGEKSRNLKKWTRVLKRYNEWIQAVYIRLDTLEEKPLDSAYQCSLLIAIPEKRTGLDNWARMKNEIDEAIYDFWSQFTPDIECDEIDIQGTDNITLEDLSGYLRFDADWLSFSDDDMPVTPVVCDFVHE